MEGKIDPRVLKTRRKLKTAFLHLLSVQSLKDFNIKDLTQTAEVTRGTFYLHFKDKETFVAAMMNQLVKELFENTMVTGETDTVQRFSLNKMLEFVEAHAYFFETLLKDKEAFSYRVILEDALYEQIETYRQALSISDGRVPKEIVLNYLLYMILGFTDGWISQGQIYATHYMADNLHKILRSEFIEEVGLSDFFIAEA